jgi:RsiW-degrading membrane proteinase PrsW (M82 family)
LLTASHALDLKNTTDDALPNYLNSVKFEQSNYYTDVRLALGFTAVLIAAGTFYFDYTLGWEATKKGTLWAVIGYFIVNALLSLWIWLVEQGCIYKGDLKGTKVRNQKARRIIQLSFFLSFFFF